jgi:hypothetical protein
LLVFRTIEKNRGSWRGGVRDFSRKREALFKDTSQCWREKKYEISGLFDKMTFPKKQGHPS